MPSSGAVSFGNQNKYWRQIISLLLVVPSIIMCMDKSIDGVNCRSTKVVMCSWFKDYENVIKSFELSFT